MVCTDFPHPVPTAVRAEDSTLFVALELSRKSWLVATSTPGEVKISKRTVAAGDGPGLVALLKGLRETAERRLGRPVTVAVIQEAGLDGFWLHRLLQANHFESHVVDPASIAVDRRKRRRKTDAIDVDGLLRTLMAWARGERARWSNRRAPRRRIVGASRGNARRCWRSGSGTRTASRAFWRPRASPASNLCAPGRPRRSDDQRRPLPRRLKGEIRRQLARLDAVVADIKAVEAERDALVDAQPATDPAATVPEPAAVLVKLKGIGPEFAAVLWFEALFRPFGNRRQVAAYAGLAPSPWQSGSLDRDQGIGKSGNSRLRKTMIELAWLWLRYQPASAISRWFAARVGTARGRVRRIAIVAVARKLLVALWRFVGVIPEGAVLKA
jgi:transposase